MSFMIFAVVIPKAGGAPLVLVFVHSFPKVTQHFWIWLSFGEECTPVNLGLCIISIMPRATRENGQINVVFLLEKSVWHWLCNIICEGCGLQIYTWCHTKRRIGKVHPVNPSFGMTSTMILIMHFFCSRRHSLCPCHRTFSFPPQLSPTPTAH